MSYRSLLSQLRKLQAMLASSPAVANTTRTTQVGACLMVWHATCSTKISFIPDICMTLPHSEWCCIATLSLRVLAHMHSINLSDTDTYTQRTPLMKYSTYPRLPLYMYAVEYLVPLHLLQVVVLCFAIFFGNWMPYKSWNTPANDYTTAAGTVLIGGTVHTHYMLMC